MTWKKLRDDGDIVKWTAGMVVIGTLVEKKTNRLGPLVVLSTEHGVGTYGVPTVLDRKLSQVEVGTLVKITCGDKVVGESGTPYWTFDVEVADADEPVPVAPGQIALDLRDADIPF